jgi:hypothetical protein
MFIVALQIIAKSKGNINVEGKKPINFNKEKVACLHDGMLLSNKKMQ